MRLLIRVIATAYLGLLVVLAILHLGLADRLPVLAVLYYATPWPVLAALLSPLWLFLLFRRRWWSMTAVGCLMAGLFFGWQHEPSRTLAPDSDGDRTRVVILNARSFFSDNAEEVFAWLASVEPDVIALVEAGVHYSDLYRRLTSQLEGMTTRAIHAQMFMAVRGSYDTNTYEFINPEEDGLRLVVVEIEVRGQRRALMIADILSNPFLHRRGAWEHLGREVALRSDLAPILVGDFNTPLESTFVSELKAVGLAAPQSLLLSRRRQATWPEFFPVLSLDQVWLPEAEAATALVWTVPTGFSDHRAVIVDF